MIHLPETAIAPVGPEESYTLALLRERAVAGREGYPLPDDVPGDIVETVTDRFDWPETYALLANVNQKPAGFSLSYPSDFDTEYLSLLMVDPDFQGRGIASTLIDIVAKRAAYYNRSRMTLWTGAFHNDHARSFYESRGFQLSTSSQVVSGDMFVRYEKDLTV